MQELKRNILKPLVSRAASSNAKGFFIYKIMTLKKYLKGAGLNITPDQRSQLGGLISKENDHSKRVIEDKWNVKDYHLKHLESDETNNIIMNFLNSIQNG